jgi:DNA replication protein DnaC
MSRSEPCPVCDGTGWRQDQSQAAVVPCECRARTRLERALAAARIPLRYGNCTFPGFNCYPEGGGRRNESLWFALNMVQSYRDAYPAVEGKGLLLTGESGVGKTHLIVALLKGLIEKGADGLFLDYQELLKRIQSSYDPSLQTAEHRIIRPMLETEVVVIDDLGANRPTDWVQDTINYILNHRYNEKKPTLLTSNLREERMSGPEGNRRTHETFEERVGTRVASRLHEMCRIVEIHADDYRKRQVR